MPGFVEPLKPAADIVITPKPEHGPDGKITSLLWSNPRELVPQLFKELGPFPLMNYWGPLAKIDSSNWIANAAGIVWREQSPTLQLVYVPHLDYDLQRFGPGSPQAIQAVRDVSNSLGQLIDSVLIDDAELVVLSEYAMRDVKRFVQPNRLLAEAGLLLTRSTVDGKIIDYAQSEAFAMCDHQIAHVYVRDRAKMQRVREVLTHELIELREEGTGHRRSGELLMESADDAWFDYRWWSDPADAPGFATQVDIHRKPGYDPLELFIDPTIRGTSQNGEKVRGSHGKVTAGEAVFIGSLPANFMAESLEATDVAGVIANLIEAAP
jgi:predicted AlkP superfamily pyrophosphatase or phosphodiesterase